MPDDDATTRAVTAGPVERDDDLATALRAILDAQASAGRSVRLWWRDDDAVRPTAALTRLLDLAGAHRVPISLAVIPALVEDSLADAVAVRSGVSVLQHGVRHASHAGPAAKKTELSDARPLADTIRELQEGRERLAALFGPRFVPVLVPPWNRAAPAVLERCADVGFAAVSMYGGFGEHGRLDTHIDPIAWRGDRGYVGDARLLAMLREALARSRQAAAPEGSTQPAAIGLLTHHLDHDAALWSTLETVVAVVASHPAVRVAAVSDLLRTV